MDACSLWIYIPLDFGVASSHTVLLVSVHFIFTSFSHLLDKHEDNREKTEYSAESKGLKYKVY